MTKMEKRLQKARMMRHLANTLRTEGSNISQDNALALIAEALAVLLEELP